MRPAGLVAVCNEIVHGARTRIVECGSGVSTVVLARLLRERDAGRLVALEHDRHWAALMHEQLRREALDGIARVLHAPLQGEPPWYAPARLRELPDEIDLLLVDGPPAYDAGHETRRAPALPRLQARLVEGAAVVLDDIARPGERDVLARLGGVHRLALRARRARRRGDRAPPARHPRNHPQPRLPVGRGGRAADRAPPTATARPRLRRQPTRGPRGPKQRAARPRAARPESIENGRLRSCARWRRSGPWVPARPRTRPSRPPRAT